MINGNIIGVSKTPSKNNASGIWTLNEQRIARIDKKWPTAWPEISDDGLIGQFDAYNPASYPGSGTTWYNLNGATNGTLNNGVTFSTSSGISKFVFDGIDDYISIPLNLTTTTYSIMAVARWTGTDNQRIIASNSTNWLMGWWNGSIDVYYAEGWVSNSGGYGSSTNWICYVSTGNYSGDSWQLYKNGVSIIGPNSNGSSGPNGIRLGGDGVYGEYSACEVSFVAIYNRVLTATEISQNFEEVRSRYSI